jgi:hypothetical protein
MSSIVDEQDQLPTSEPAPGEATVAPVGDSVPLTDLSLSELIGEFFHRPRATLQDLGGVLADPTPSEANSGTPPPTITRAYRQARTSAPARSLPKWLVPSPIATPVLEADEVATPAIPAPHLEISTRLTLRSVVVLLGLIILVVLGQGAQTALVESRTTPIDITPLNFPGMMLLGLGVLFGVLVWLDVNFERLPPITFEDISQRTIIALPNLFAKYGLRVISFAVAVLATKFAWDANPPSGFTEEGVFWWILSIVTWVITLNNQPLSLESLRTSAGSTAIHVRNFFTKPLKIRWSWTLIALVVILAAGAWFRFSNLSAYPPDMTSDHVEKARDAYFISQGARPIFLDNNGGREPAHFYFLVLLHDITGLPFAFDLLKIGSGIWGMVAILLAYWMGRAVLGEEDRDLGNLTGLVMAAMVATSYWHTMLSRLGLRIVSTTVVATLLMIFLIRALRHNRRSDWIISGLVLGGGMYFYQAVRMLPVVVIVAFILALVVRVRSRRAFVSYSFNFIALVIVSLAVFAPLARYMIELPQSFWQRSSGRLFGEDTIEVKDENGGVIGLRAADNADRLKALNDNLPVLATNMEKSVWMFNWQGDRAWITGSVNGDPELDTFTGVFFIFGLGLMLVRVVKRRDPSDWLLPLSILIMLLPTALSIAYIIEVPSATRASGAFPMVYFLAAFALALTVRMIVVKLAVPLFRTLVYVAVIAALLLGAMANWDTYFVTAMKAYRDSTLPHHQVGEILRGFSESVGSSGNAFMVNYPNWLDHRALAIEAGDIRWPNGILEDNLKTRLIGQITGNIGTPYELRPDRQMLFFLNKDVETATPNSLAILQEMFPNGVVTHVDSYNITRDFLIYTVQPVGCDWVVANIPATTTFCPPPAPATPATP